MNPRESAEAAEQPPSPGDPEEGKAQAYGCTVCGRSFPFQSSLSQHMRRHTGARPYKCPYCRHRASQKGNLRVHIRSHKLGTLTSRDQEGEEPEEGSGEVGVSEGLEGGASPTESGSACNGVLNGAEEGRGEPALGRGAKREKQGAEPRPFRCRLCGYEAQREDQLLGHIEKAHITADAEEEEAPAEAEEDFACATCGQAFAQAWLLKAHAKKHAGALEHGCHVCGRRFREAWFLKSHMKTHGASRASSRGRPRSESEPLATINDVAQDPEAAAASGAACLYEICSKCGNVFRDKESLRAHDKAHGLGQGKQPRRHGDDRESPAAKRRFMEYFSLRPAGGAAEKAQEERRRLGQRIPELDPVCSYQAWQLATKGRVLEPAESSVKPASWDEGLAAAAVTYDRESGRYVLASQDGRAARRSSAGGAGHASLSDRSPALSDSEYRPWSRQDRRRPSQSKATECFECGRVFRSRHQLTVHLRAQHREGRGSGVDADSGSPSRPSTPALSGDALPEAAAAQPGPPTATDEKPYICSLCDFVTAESSVFLSHVRHMHPAPSPSPPACPSPGSERGAPGSCPKLKRALLHGLGPAAAPCSPSSLAARSAGSPQESPLDLCVRAGGSRGPTSSSSSSSSSAQDGLLSHRCSYCSHSTRYPEVLWMHQTVAHRINSSTLAPKWALRNGFRGPREGSSARRRTGPPPAMDGKECPPLPSSVRAPRTRPPATPGGSQKRERSSGQQQPSTSSSATGSHRSSAAPHSFSSSSAAPHSFSSSSAAPHRSSTSSAAPQSSSTSSSSTPHSSSTSSAIPQSSSTSSAAPHHSSTSLGAPQSSSTSSAAPHRSSTSSATPQSSSTSSSSTPHSSRTPRAGSRQRAELEEEQASRGSRPRAEVYPGVAPAGRALEKSSPKTGARMVERYLLPQEGLGFMLSSKHGLSKHSRSKSASPLPQARGAKPQSQQEPSAHSTTLGHLHRASQPHGGALLGSPSSLRTDAKREPTAATPDTPMDILSFLKNCNSLYHRWGSANPLGHTGMLRSLARQGDYICQECGKSFSQPSHLRTHMRSHTGERPFRCRHCPYRASQKGNLKTHVQSVHHRPFDNTLYPGGRLAQPGREGEEDYTPAPSHRPGAQRRPHHR